MDPLERLAIVVRAKVLDIFQKKYFRLVSTKFPNDPSDVEEQEAAFILEATLLASNGKWLARKAGSQDVNRFQMVAFDAKVFYWLM